MPKIAQQLQNIGFRHGVTLDPDDIDYSEPIADGWSIALSSEYNLIAVLHYSIVLVIDAEILLVQPDIFWDAVKKLVINELATITANSKQLALF